jgi:hypothetical protein
VTTTNLSTAPTRYPDVRKRSITEALPLGTTPTGDPVGANFRESGAYLWGRTGSGMTTARRNIVAGLVQCTDAMVWVIDLTGNDFSAFTKPAGENNRRAIDWAATTPAEACEMMRVAAKVALDRKGFYAGLRMAANTNLMPVGTGADNDDPPAITIVAELSALADLREDLGWVMNLSRDSGINVVLSGRSASSEVADSSVRAGTAIRIGMQPFEPAEVAFGFGRHDIDLSGGFMRGEGLIETEWAGVDGPQRFRTHLIDPFGCLRIAEQVAAWRPQLDTRGLAIAGEAYETRWDRAPEWLS